MLVILPPRSLDNNEREVRVMEQQDQGADFSDFSVENLLESLDFDDFFVGINDGDPLPCLEMDLENFPDFSVPIADKSPPPPLLIKKDERKVSESSSSSLVHVKKKPVEAKSYTKEKRSTTPSSKNLNGKKKAKVDWTPELHRRFVQAVEQLGVEKAVPSRILELMGIDCLTRHNVASHLQKYRSHRKHLLTREAEAANWNQRRQIYGASAPGGSGSGKKDRVSPWITPPTIGFPPVPSVPPFRPLHVWGHPPVDQSYMHMWPPKYMSQPPAPPHAWPAPPQQPNSQLSGDPSLWIPHHNVPTPGTPCFSPHLPPPPAVTQRFPAIPVPGIPPPPPPGTFGVPAIQTLPQPPSDIHPSTETVDATIGDVLSKPWMPLPLGLKPPSVESVMVELQRQGISKIPTSFS